MLDALREVVTRSRPDLRPGDAAVIWPLASSGGTVLGADLVTDILRGAPMRPVGSPGDIVGANPSRDAAEFPLFPYPKLRDGQRALMRDVRAAVEGRKVLLAHAPTGIGKTAAVLSAALEAARLRNKTVMFLTNRQTQHKMALQTLREVEGATQERLKVIDLVSKQSMCPRPERPEHAGSFYEWCSQLTEQKQCRYFLKPTERARDALLDAILDADASVRSSARLGCCPHKVAVEAAEESEIIVCDYNALFNPHNTTLDRIKKELGDLIVVVDEAHNLPDRIRDGASAKITHSLLQESAGELSAKSAELSFAVQQLAKIFEGVIAQAPDADQKQLRAEALREPLEKTLSTALVPRTYDSFIGELEKAARRVVSSQEGRSATLDVVEFLRGWAQPETETLRIADKTNLPCIRVTLLDPATVASEVLASAHAAVLMSGTLYPMELAADLLGVPQERRMMESYPTPFLAERRRILLLRGVSTRYRDRGEQMFSRIAAGIAAAAKATPGNLAVFFPSYRLRDEVEQRLPKRIHQEVVLETREMTRGEKDRLTGRLKAAERKGGALLMGVMGGSFSEGVDFYDGILKAVVVVGLPLAPPSREIDALVGYFDRKFGNGAGEMYAYLNPALTRVLQASGRLIRREEDRGVVVLMDERLEQGRYARMLPPDFRPEPVEDPEDLQGRIAAFFKEGD
jgi:DNA excision repair protein ERCC-2